MNATNNITLIGRLATDPDIKVTASGVSVVRFNIAVNRKYKDNSGKYLTDFIKVETWKNTADFVARNFKKGQWAAVLGELHVNTYTDKDGNSRTSYVVAADEVSFCGNSEKQAESPASVGAFNAIPSAPAGYDFTGDDSDLPF